MNESIFKILKHPATIPAGVGVAAFGVGLGIGYFLGRGRKPVEKVTERFDVPAQREFFDLTNTELDEIQKVPEVTKPQPLVIEAETYEAIREMDNLVDEGEAFVAQKLQESVTQDADDEGSGVEVISKSIFANSDDDWNMAEEVASRTTTEPYVIHRDEFYENENDYSQVTVTFYEGDEIMADQEDKPVYNYAQVIGEMKFGHGSGDPNVFYVRNDKYKAEYEVFRDSGLFAVEVGGLEIEDTREELRHSGLRKFRDRD